MFIKCVVKFYRILVGKHKSALDCYKAAIEMGGGKDWEICNSQAVCCKYLKQYDHVCC